MTIAETERLLIRQLRRTDGPAMLRVFGDAEVMRFSTSGVRDAAWVDAWIERCLGEYQTRTDYGAWAVALRKTNEAIGYCGLTQYGDSDQADERELGYRLARAYWGQGYATEAVIAIRDYAFSVIGLRRLVALVDPNNVASVRIAEKLDMRHEGDVMLEGYTHPDHLYVLRREEPTGHKEAQKAEEVEEEG